MYLASGYCKYHGYDEGSMDVVEYHYNQHLGLLLIYELPDTVKAKGDGSGSLLHRLGYPDEAAARTAPFRGLLWTGYAQGRRNPLR